LAPNGGLLGLLSKLTGRFLGGLVGSGRQYISWIHITDLSRMVLASIKNQELTGAFNATSPNPVTNAEFMRELRRALHRPWSPPVPEFAARIGSWLMGTEADLALVSQHCVPKRFREKRFQFRISNFAPGANEHFSKANERVCHPERSEEPHNWSCEYQTFSA